MKFLIVMFVLSGAAATAPAKVAGAWKFDFQRDSRDAYPDPPDPSVCTFKQDGRNVTGGCGSDAASVMGKIAGNHLTLRVESWSKATLTGDVSVDGTTITGTWRAESGFGRFTASKQ